MKGKHSRHSRRRTDFAKLTRKFGNLTVADLVRPMDRKTSKALGQINKALVEYVTSPPGILHMATRANCEAIISRDTVRIAKTETALSKAWDNFNEWNKKRWIEKRNSEDKILIRLLSRNEAGQKREST